MKQLLVLGLLLVVTQPVLAGERVLATYYHEDKYVWDGSRFDPKSLTIAHRTKPMYSWWILKYRTRQVVVQVKDRGPCFNGGPCSKVPSLKARIQKVEVDMTPRVKALLNFPGKAKVELLPYPPLPRPRPVVLQLVGYD